MILRLLKLCTYLQKGTSVELGVSGSKQLLHRWRTEERLAYGLAGGLTEGLARLVGVVVPLSLCFG